MTKQFRPLRSIFARVVDQVSVDRLGGARHDGMFVLLDLLSGTFAGTGLRLGGFGIEYSVVVNNHALQSRIFGGDYVGQLYAIIFREYIVEPMADIAPEHERACSRLEDLGGERSKRHRCRLDLFASHFVQL